METVTVKFKTEVLDDIDQAIDTHRFTSRTEFIREAVRDKLHELEKEVFINAFLSLRGKGRKTTNAQRRKAREESIKELAEELGLSLD